MITLIPYVKADDGYTITDEVLKNLWLKLHQDNTANVVFYDGGITTALEFIHFFKNSKNLPVIILVKDQIAGFAWLNGISGGYAFAHFAFFKETWGKYTEQMGKQLLDYWMGFGVIYTLLGMVPKFNKKAINFVEGIGFTKSGEIPDLMYSPYKRERLDVVLLYYQR